MAETYLKGQVIALVERRSEGGAATICLMVGEGGRLKLLYWLAPCHLQAGSIKHGKFGQALLIGDIRATWGYLNHMLPGYSGSVVFLRFPPILPFFLGICTCMLNCHIWVDPSGGGGPACPPPPFGGLLYQVWGFEPQLGGCA